MNHFKNTVWSDKKGPNVNQMKQGTWTTPRPLLYETGLGRTPPDNTRQQLIRTDERYKVEQALCPIIMGRDIVSSATASLPGFPHL